MISNNLLIDVLFSNDGESQVFSCSIVSVFLMYPLSCFGVFKPTYFLYKRCPLACFIWGFEFVFVIELVFFSNHIIKQCQLNCFSFKY